MRKLIVQEYISLDGFVSDVKGGLAFTTPYIRDGGGDTEVGRLINSIDTIILGEVTYRLFVKVWPGRTNNDTAIADSLNATPKIVFSQKLKQAPWGDWEAARVIVGSRAEKEVSKLKQQDGKDMVVWGSISLAQSLIKAGLVDEYRLLVCPVALGEGRKLFAGGGALIMKLLETKTYDSGLVLMRYEPAERRD